MLDNIAFFHQKGEKNHLIINIESGVRGELPSCPNTFVWDCLKEEFRECHSIALKRLEKRGVVPSRRGQLRSATKEKQHAMASFIWVGI